MKNYYLCLSMLVLFLASLKASAQTATYGQEASLRIEAAISNGKITIRWKTYSSVSTYRVYRMTSGAWPSSPSAIYASSVTSHVDSNISPNNVYEYKVVGTRSGTDALAYISVAYQLNETPNKGTVAVIIDSSLVDDLEEELNLYRLDLIGDGYQVVFCEFDSNNVAEILRDSIQDLAANYSDLTAVFLVGNLPYYYTGEMSPDGHTDHHGAWPSDMILADLDGSYTDNNVKYTNTTDSRLTNQRNDDKTDQSYLSSDADIQIGRLDMSELSSFSQSEINLYKNYFAKLHAFKTGAFVPRNIGIIDDNFTSYSEGFSQNGYRNFGPFVGIDSVFNADIVSTTDNSSALWSYTCGAGTYTSISGFASTSGLAGKSLDGVFAFVLGSYNADPDVENNLMRAMLANGNFLTVGWAGRPNWFVHHMASGQTIGYSTMISQNNNGFYEPTGLYSRGMHVLLLGDPTLKSHYTGNVANLYTIRTVGKDTAMLSWNSVSGALGYNIYRSIEEESGYSKINSSLITGTSYDDPIADDTSYYYRIETVEFVGAYSGSYYESSVGSYIISDFNAAPVPVTLVSFNAIPKEETVELKWTVAQEVNFSHYTVEKFNENSNTWEALGDVQPQGNTYSLSYYTFLDQTPKIGKNIYRLKMIDFDMSYEYSPVQVVVFDKGGRYGQFDIYPRPAKDYVEVSTSFNGDFDSREFIILSANGQEVLRMTITAHNNRIDLGTLTPGLYFIKDSKNLGETQKLVISN